MTAVGHFAQIAEKDISPLALLLHLLAAADVHRQLAADGLQTQPQLFLNFRIRRDGFFRFAGERHPHAGDMHHDGHRPAGQRTARLAQPVAAPIGAHDRLRDRAGPRLELQRHAVGVPQHVHRLPFLQIDAPHGRVQLGDFGRAELAGRSPIAQLGLGQNPFGRVGADAAKAIDQELPQRAGVALGEHFGQPFERHARRGRDAAVGQRRLRSKTDCPDRRSAAAWRRRKTRPAPPGANP